MGSIFVRHNPLSVPIKILGALKISKTLLLSAFFYFLACVDLIQVFNVRPLMLLPLCYVLIQILRARRTPLDLYYVIAFVAACIPSIYFSQNIVQSAAYLIWPLFNFFSIFCAFYFLAKSSLKNTLLGIIWCSRIQIVLAFILWFLGLQPRAHLFFFEPSYFAISLAFYVTWVFVGSRNNLSSKKWDYFLIFLALISTAAAMLMLTLLVVTTLVLLASIKRLRFFVLFAMITIIAGVASTYYVNKSDSLLANSISALASAPSNLDVLLSRSGNRWPRIKLAKDVFVSNPMGVGVGAYEEHATQEFYPKHRYREWWLDPYGKPAVNIFLEIGATCGWAALFIWIIWMIRLLLTSHRHWSMSEIYFLYLLVLLSLFMVESNYLRPYIWAIFGVIAGLKSNRSTNAEIETRA